MMHERQKSDLAVVAMKLANKAERSATEPVERRAGTKGNAGQHSTCRAQYRVSVSPALERIRHVRRQTPEVGAVCGKAARTVLCGGRSAMSVPTAIVAALLAMTKGQETEWQKAAPTSPASAASRRARSAARNASEAAASGCICGSAAPARRLL